MLMGVVAVGISRITRDDAKKMVNRTMRIPGETGDYVVGLSVFRQLQCVDMLRKHIWSSSPSTGNEQLSQCLEALRQSVMCASDVTPLVWVWDEKKHVAKEVTEVQHTCVDFEKQNTGFMYARINP
ncbi:hypothetical protein K440DRAFT_642085 [Wilcoxina mikolae CBS 423.85]|nr:hypothetical protein K440DRAFT_642085 [Wilcoxina mikolae CBS 423.85]